MLSIYIFSLVLGGSFLLVSLLGDAFGADADVDVDVDFEPDFDFSDAGEALDAAEAAEAVEAADAGGTEALKIFSIRGLIYALFGFGAVGTLLTWLGEGDVVWTLVAALVAGILTGGIVTALFNWLKATGESSRPGDGSFVGLTGRVTLPLADGSPGTVLVDRGARRIALRALPFEGAGTDPSKWRSVVVVEMRRGVARVAPVEEDLALEP